MFGLTVRDHGELLVEEFNLLSQLAAIRALVRRHREADAALGREIQDIAAEAARATGEHGMHLENAWVDHLHASVFHDAAHSASAVGMLAPLTESWFVAIFRAMGGQGLLTSGEVTGPRAGLPDGQLWDPHLVMDAGRPKPRGDVSAGIVQLAEATGLAGDLPDGWAEKVDAMLKYRNKMLHHGFEWPEGERVRFANLIAERGWPGHWFQTSESGGKPWIFYLSDAFIDEYLTLIDGIVEGAGTWVVRRESARRAAMSS
jgi:hypothetical protein